MHADSEQPSESAWRDHYLAALFEADPAKLLERIAEAEYSIQLRDRELWYSGGDHSKEKLALTGAMRALEALRNIHQYARPVSPPAARPLTRDPVPISKLSKSAGSLGPQRGAVVNQEGLVSGKN